MLIIENKIKTNRIDLSNKAYLLEPSAAPLYAFIEHLNSKSAMDTSIGWLEGDPPHSQNLVTRSNYLQIFKKTISWINGSSPLIYGGLDRPYQRKKRTIEMMRDMERSFLYGVKDVNCANNPRYYRTMGGMEYWLKTVGNQSITVDSSTLSQRSFVGDITPAYRYGSATKYLFANGPTLAKLLPHLGLGNLFPFQKTYGVGVSQHPFPIGNLNVVMDRMMRNDHVLILDLEYLAYRYLLGRNIQIEWIPPKWEQVFCECCIEPKELANHLSIEII